MPKVKIMVSFSQLVSGFGFVLNVEFPPLFVAFTKRVLDVFNVSWFRLAPFECWYPQADFFTELVFDTLWPIGLSVILIGMYLLFDSRKRHANWRAQQETDDEKKDALKMEAESHQKYSASFFTFFLFLTYLVLPSTASKIFSSFRYDPYCEGPYNGKCKLAKGGVEHYMLALDYSIERGTPRARLVRMYATIMVFVYVIGIPFLYVVLLYRHQEELSIHEPFKFDPAKLWSFEERQRLAGALKAYFLSNETLGHGVNDHTFELLENKAKTDKFIDWLQDTPEEPVTSRMSAGGRYHPPSATLLPLLKDFYTHQDDEWEKLVDHHMLRFLLGWEKRVYWFEVVEVSRRLCLSGVLVLFGAGTAVQAAMSVLICMFSIKVYSFYAPFRSDADDFLQEVAQWQIFMVLLASILDRMEVASESGFDQTALGVILLVFVIPGYMIMVWQCVKAWGTVKTETALMKETFSWKRAEEVENPMNASEDEEIPSDAGDETAGDIEMPPMVVGVHVNPLLDTKSAARLETFDK